MPRNGYVGLCTSIGLAVLSKQNYFYCYLFIPFLFEEESFLCESFYAM